MAKIKVWTKQNEKVLDELRQTGRYTTKQEFIVKDLEEHAELVLETYRWLTRHSPDYPNKPEDVEFPVWVSFQENATMMPSEGTVILELLVEESLITKVNIAKWGAILNYGYIPADKEDDRRHRELLKDYGISDTKAYMSQFYPEIKREIQESWIRLFDPGIHMGNDSCYGNLWEVRKEWIMKIIR